MYRSAISSRIHLETKLFEFHFPFFPTSYFNNSPSVRNYSNNVRESRFMGKILAKNAPKRKLKFHPAAPESPSSIPVKCSQKVNLRRMTVLNKLFMEHITDLMATKTWHPNFNDKGFEITRVSINSDFKSLNAFWFSETTCGNFEQILTDIAHQLHHELSQLQLMGAVPKITFVKDTKKEKFLEVDRLLKSLPSTNHSLASDEDNNHFEENQQMAMNIYGLEHDAIMKKLGFGPPTKINKRKKEECNE